MVLDVGWAAEHEIEAVHTLADLPQPRPHGLDLPEHRLATRAVDEGAGGQDTAGRAARGRCPRHRGAVGGERWGYLAAHGARVDVEQAYQLVVAGPFATPAALGEPVGAGRGDVPGLGVVCPQAHVGGKRRH